jgi:predicted HTH transcriptional regulator
MLVERIKCYKIRQTVYWRGGEENMTLTIDHEKTREVTREDVDQAIDVIERHLEKEARTRNLLDEEAIMRPKDLCKQQGLDMVAELRGMA